MKYFLFLSLVVFSSSLFGQEFVEISFNVFDDYTKQKVKNNHVTVTDGRKKLILDTFVGDSFKLKFKVKKKDYWMTIHNDENFVPTYKSFNTKEIQSLSKIQINLSLYPNTNYIERLLEELKITYKSDDGFYGDTSQLPKFNNLDSNFIAATFPGGQSELQKFVSNRIVYPQQSIELGEQGNVYISFIVEKDGTLSHIKIEKGVCPTLDLETARLVKLFPKFIPAKLNGEIIRCMYKFPMKFTLH